MSRMLVYAGKMSSVRHLERNINEKYADYGNGVTVEVHCKKNGGNPPRNGGDTVDFVGSIGENIQLLIDRPDGKYCFRLHQDRIYYASEMIMKLAAAMPRDNLVSFGTCFGKITKTKKFRLHITCLDFLAPYAKFKVWVKPGSEQSFLYGNHVLKSGLARITDNCDKYQGVVVYSMSDVPLGFGVAAKTTQECRHTDPLQIVVFHQADVGEYLRHEDSL